MMTRDEALLFGGILTSLKKRLASAKHELSNVQNPPESDEQRAKRQDYRYMPHLRGRIDELTAVITELLKTATGK